MIGDAGSNAMPGAVRCSASMCEAHMRSPIATRHSRGSIDATSSYGSSPSRQPIDLLGLERLSGDGVEGELPLELRHDQDGVAVRPDHQQPSAARAASDRSRSGTTRSGEGATTTASSRSSAASAASRSRRVR